MTCKHNNYQRGCECCRRTSTAANQRRRDALRDGRLQPPVPADKVKPHLERLRDSGMALTVIAARADVNRHTIQRLAGGRRTYVLAHIADAILAVEPEPLCRTTGEHAAGTARRLQALMTKGWRLADISGRSGVAVSTLWYVVVGRNNTVASTAAAGVRNVYDELYAAEGPSDRVRRSAARHGWLGPGAWDDDTIDDPDTLPNLGGAGDDIVDHVAITEALAGRVKFTDLSEAERLTLFRDYAGDWSYNQIMRALKVSTTTVQKWRTRVMYGDGQVAA